MRVRGPCAPPPTSCRTMLPCYQAKKVRSPTHQRCVRMIPKVWRPKRSTNELNSIEQILIILFRAFEYNGQIHVVVNCKSWGSILHCWIKIRRFSDSWANDYFWCLIHNSFDFNSYFFDLISYWIFVWNGKYGFLNSKDFIINFPRLIIVFT